MTDREQTEEEAGMTLYQYIVDNSDTCAGEMTELIGRIREADSTGQFLASTARYLAAIDRERFEPWLAPLIEGAIEKDRERRYIGSLLEAIWGAGFEERAEELRASDDNFRRIWKRIHTEGQPM